MCLMNWSPLELTYSHIKGFMAWEEKKKKEKGEEEDELFRRVMK